MRDENGIVMCDSCEKAPPLYHGGHNLAGSAVDEVERCWYCHNRHLMAHNLENNLTPLPEGDLDPEIKNYALALMPIPDDYPEEET